MMSHKRANLELGWATIAGITGWVGSNGGILTWIALIIFVSMATLLAFLIVHGAFTRGKNN